MFHSSIAPRERKWTLELYVQRAGRTVDATLAGYLARMGTSDRPDVPLIRPTPVPDLTEQQDAHSKIAVGPDCGFHLAPGVGMRVPEVVFELEQHGPSALLQRGWPPGGIPPAARTVIHQSGRVGDPESGGVKHSFSLRASYSPLLRVSRSPTLCAAIHSAPPHHFPSLRQPGGFHPSRQLFSIPPATDRFSPPEFAPTRQQRMILT